jgi:malonyl-CoA O-methyltransferase
VADLVVGNLVLEHVDDLAPVYAEIGRALKPGGLLFISELHPDRQMRGSRAQFERNGKATLVEAYVHSVSDYVAGAEAAGLVLTGLNEAIEAGAEVDEDTPPRLLALTFSKPL